MTAHPFKAPPGEPFTPAYQAAAERFAKEWATTFAKSGVEELDLAWTTPAWAHPDITFWSRVVAPEDAAWGAAKIEFGGRVNGGEPVVVHTFEFTVGSYSSDGLAIRSARLRPDGKELGVVAVGCGALFYVQLLGFRIPVDELVASVRAAAR